MKFPCYSKIPKPFDHPDETDIIAMRDIFNKAKQKVIYSEDMEARKYFTSNECLLLLDDLFWMFSKTVIQQIIEEKDDLHDGLIRWFKQTITAELYKEHVNVLKFFKKQVMAGIVPSTVFPDIYMPRSIYYYWHSGTILLSQCYTRIARKPEC